MSARPPGTTRLAFANIDNFPARVVNNPKVLALKAFARQWGPDIIAGCEAGLDWTRMPAPGRLPQLFRTETALKVSAAHNSNESTGRRQRGGTFILAFGQTAARATQSGKDPSGLGRWAWMRFHGKAGVVTRVVAAYQPCRSAPAQLLTTYNQQERHWRRLHRSSDPRAAFKEDLVAQLRQWRQQGERLILLLDANECTLSGPLQHLLSEPGLEMRECIQGRHHALPTTPTFNRGGRSGRYPVDGIFVTPDLPILQGAWLAVDKGVADHRTGLIDIRTEVLLGDDVLRIERPQARRLACSIPRSVERYNSYVESHFIRYNMLPKLHEIFRHRGAALGPDHRDSLNRLDRVRTEIMRAAEKRCRHLRMGEIDFSPEINQARQTKLLWRLIVKKKKGGKVNSSTIQRKARLCHLHAPLSCTLAQAELSALEADRAWRAIKPKSGPYRQAFLQERANNTDGSLSQEEQVAAARLLQQERQREAYRLIQRVLKKRKAGSVGRIEVENEGEWVTFEDQASVEHHIMANNTKRFRLTEHTPLMQAPFRDRLGYLGISEDAQKILDGQFLCPPETDQFTRLFIEGLKRPDTIGRGVRSEITMQDYQGYWRKAREKTSSSISGLHFGHWKAAATNDFISETHALFTDIASHTGHSYPRWQAGLSVMLEKVQGVIRVDKLRAILLMEADFNFFNKAIFGSRMMDWAETHQLIPNEAYGSRKNHQAIEVALNRRFAADLFRQKRRNSDVL